MASWHRLLRWLLPAGPDPVASRAREAERLAHVGTWEVDLPANRLRYSDEALRIHGLKRAQFDGTLAGAIALAHPEDRVRLANAINGALYEGKPFAIDYRIVRPDGSVRHVHAEDEVERDAAGLPVRAFGITQDVTEQREAERALRESEERYRSVIAAMNEGVVMQESGGGIVACNDSAARILGLSREQMLGLTSLDPRWRAVREDGSPFPGEDHPAMRTMRTGVAQTGVVMGVHRVDGTLAWISINSEPLFRPGEAAPYAVVTTFHDITDRRVVERALREERRHLSLVADNVPAMIAYVDAQGRYRYANRSYRQFYAGSEASLDGRRLDEVLRPEIWRVVQPRIEEALSGRAVTYTGERSDRDGRRRFVSVSLVPHRDEAVQETRGVYILALDVTERYQAEAALRASEAGLKHAQELASLAHVVVNPDGSYERWSDNWPRLMGLDPANVPRSTRESLSLVHGDDRERFRAAVIEAARTRRRMVIDYRFRRADGAVIDVHQVMEPLDAAGGSSEPRWFVTLQDVTEQKRAEERTRRLNRVLAVLSGINAAIVRIRERQELFDEACRIATEAGGFVMAWAGVVDRGAGVVRPVAWQGTEARAFLDAAPLALLDAGAAHGLPGQAVRERRMLLSNDIATDPQRLMKAECAARGINSLAVIPLVLGEEAVAVLALYARERGFFDEEELRLLRELAGDLGFALDHMEKEERVRYLAYYDQLTGLANRALFLERLEQRLADAAREGRSLALLLINIDRFKTINDTLGRPAGDALLKEFARRLLASAGDASLVARVSGDHFAVMLPGVKDDESLRRRLDKGDARVKAAPFAIAGQELRLATRSGVALFPRDAADAESLYGNAEAALKLAHTGETYLFFRQEMTERVAEKLRLENRLRSALEHREFVLYYQPKLELATRRIVGAEALIRWASAEGLVAPGQFVPLLEETGLILPVGDWAIAKAVEDHRRWQEQGLPPLRIAVNVSAIQLRQADFVARLKQLLAAGAAQPGIDLELTESLLMEDVAASIAKLKAVRDLGVAVTIDDFGTGYSSLSYLARLPVQTLKVDRSFVASMAEDPDAMTLVSTIVSLARSLRLKVVAEGVETPMQETLLRGMRCDEAQGFLYAKPMPAAEFEALLASRGSG